MMIPKNDKPIGEVLKLMIEEMRLDSRLHEATIREHWQKNMGTTINKQTRELRLRNRKLFISIDSAPLRQELSIGREQLRHSLNNKLGEEYIKEVIIR